MRDAAETEEAGIRRAAGAVENLILGGDWSTAVKLGGTEVGLLISLKKREDASGHLSRGRSDNIVKTICSDVYIKAVSTKILSKDLNLAFNIISAPWAMVRYM